MAIDSRILCPTARVLMGPGPSDVPARVLRALSWPTIGHLDPLYFQIMDDTSDLLRDVMRTRNELTFAAAGTGSAGMEMCLVNLLEPGDRALICVAGLFGQRMCDAAQRCGAVVDSVEAEWGRTIEPEQVAAALREHPDTKLVAIVHAETSTGAHQPIEEISDIVHDAGSLLVVDIVTSLGGDEVEVDGWQIDACFSATQKCLSCPPGLAPVSFSPRAVEVARHRKTKVQSWYLDLTQIADYWGDTRVYHHTAPVNMTYALRESLHMLISEGMEARFAKQRVNHLALRAGLEMLGFSYVPTRSLTMLNAVWTPERINERRARRKLLSEFGIEIGAGLGPLAGRAWRIGLMGMSCTRRNVTLFLTALESVLAEQDAPIERGAAIAAANSTYDEPYVTA